MTVKIVFFLFSFISLSFIAYGETKNTSPVDYSPVRDFYLKDLPLLHTYHTKKNSFLIRDVKKGQIYTLLDVTGCGSIRHIWSTWWYKPGLITEPGLILINIFVDGESSPSMTGKIEEFFLAGEKTGQIYLPEPTYISQNDNPNYTYHGYNWYLPIFFSKSIRIEIEPLDDMMEFYAQLDYRTSQHPESSARLISRESSDGLHVEYRGEDIPSWKQSPSQNSTVTKSVELTLNNRIAQYSISGPSVIHSLTFEGTQLDSLVLSIFWDNETTPSVIAPLRYFFGGFENGIAIDTQPGKYSTYFLMPFEKNARIVLSSKTPQYEPVKIHYTIERMVSFPREICYFHAQYNEEEKTPGFREYEVVSILGEGQFIGINLFDSGENHGGGDIAFIDARTESPSVLHGICGEDYFTFAWHGTGSSHLFAGAPVHERRFRYHFENPYTFRESLKFSFGTFAGIHLKSVTFWYQLNKKIKDTSWETPRIVWNVFGPIDMSDNFPDSVHDNGFATTLLLNKQYPFLIQWKNVAMVNGFLNLTYHFRSFNSPNTSFIPYNCKYKVYTYIYSPGTKSISGLFGNDDNVTIGTENGEILIPERNGFGVSPVTIDLYKGWNKLSMVFENRENTNNRWTGIFLSFKKNQLKGITFSPSAEQFRDIESFGLYQ